MAMWPKRMWKMSEGKFMRTLREEEHTVNGKPYSVVVQRDLYNWILLHGHKTKTRHNYTSWYLQSLESLTRRWGVLAVSYTHLTLPTN